MKTRILRALLAVTVFCVGANVAQAFYDPGTQRWVNRDPIRERGGLNMYSFVHNNAISRADALGLIGGPIEHFPGEPRPKCKTCQEIIDEEKKNLDWLKDLPSCPCSISGGNPDSSTWYDPEPASKKYHPGATQCMRSKPKTDGGPGQQCCFDSSGNLITGGAAAGTPDKVAPDGPIDALKHYRTDVIPFERCGWEKYLEMRPPNNGNKCAKNEL